MRKSQALLLPRLALVSLLLPLLLAGTGIAIAQNAIVRFHFFYSEECDHCRSIKDEFLPALLARYGRQVEINYLEISDAAVLEQMVALEQRYNVPPEMADIPEVYIGDQALVGAEQIQARLPELIDQLLAQGGAELPALPAAATGPADKAVARFLLFYGETCPHCHEVMDNYLPTVYEKYGDQVEYRYIEVWSETDNYLTMLGLETRLGVPQDRQGSVPALVIGDKVLIGSVEIPAKLEGYVDEYLAQGGVDFPSLEDLPTVVPPTPQPTVQILVFYDVTHPDYQAVNRLLVQLSQTYSGGLQAYLGDVSKPEAAAILAQLHTALGVQPPASGTPEVLIDRHLLVGRTEIEARLPGLIEKYLAEGGKALPSLEELVAATPVVTAMPTVVARPIYLAYFEKAGCQECARTNYDLRVVKERYPQLVVERFAIEDRESIELNAWLCDKYNVPQEKRLSTPMIFVGDEVLLGEEATLANLLQAVSRYATTGTERTWHDFDPEAGRSGILNPFKQWGVFTILGAGLIDGLNPCAFATLVFFISYMSFTGRRGRDILLVGGAFALGVFLTYLLVGAGLLQVVQSFGFFALLGRWVYLLTALLCAVLAAFTFRDFYRARRGQVSEMTLKLPLSLRRRIHKVIRENAQARAFVVTALVSGFIVSLIELACTGQVYLPTIVYVLSVPELAAKAFLYLLLYCLMFIVPLIVVFVLSYFGTTSEQLGRFVNRHTSTVKLLTGGLFVGLALWMTWTLAPLFRIASPWNWLLMAGVVVAIAAGAALLSVGERPAPKRRATQRRRKGSRA